MVTKTNLMQRPIYQLLGWGIPVLVLWVMALGVFVLAIGLKLLGVC